MTRGCRPVRTALSVKSLRNAARRGRAAGGGEDRPKNGGETEGAFHPRILTQLMHPRDALLAASRGIWVSPAVHSVGRRHGLHTTHRVRLAPFPPFWNPPGSRRVIADERSRTLEATARKRAARSGPTVWSTARPCIISTVARPASWTLGQQQRSTRLPKKVNISVVRSPRE